MTGRQRSGAIVFGKEFKLIGQPAQWTETILAVNEHDPFFFDHTLDHVPGNLQIFGLLDVIRAVAGPRLGFESGTRLRLSVEFPAFCELHGEVRLGCCEITAQRSRVWRVRAEQDRSTVCTGMLELVTEADRVRRASIPAEHTDDIQTNDNDREDRIAGHRVHRAHVDNVIIGNPQDDSSRSVQVPIISPGPDHFLMRSSYGERSPEELIEAARQFAVLLEHMAFGGKGEFQTILQSVDADFLCGIPRIPLALRALNTERRGARVSHTLVVIDTRRNDVLGVFSLAGLSVSKTAYERMRKIR